MPPTRRPRGGSHESWNSTYSSNPVQRGVFGIAMENVVIDEDVNDVDEAHDLHVGYGGNTRPCVLQSRSYRSYPNENTDVVRIPPPCMVTPTPRRSFDGDNSFSPPRQGSVHQINDWKTSKDGTEECSGDSPFGVSPLGKVYDVHSRYKNFHSKLVTKQTRHLIYEICSDGSVTLLELSTRELCSYIHECLDADHHVEGDGGATNTVSKDTVNNAAAAAAAAVTSVISPPESYPTSVGHPSGELVGWRNKFQDCRSSSANKRSAMSFASLKNSFNLLHRDLRMLFTGNYSSEPCVAVRRGVVIMHMESIKAIVLRNRLLLIVAQGADSVLNDIEQQMAVISSYDYSPDFEFRAYEAILDISMSHLNLEVKCLEPKVRKIVELLESTNHAATSAESNDEFRGLMNCVNELLRRTRSRQRAISAILDEDADLSLMNLTRMMEQPYDYMIPLDQSIMEQHDEVEILFENSLQDTCSLINVLEIIKDRMRNTEALIMVKLDIARNRLLTADTIFGMISMCAGFGAVFTGIMGMNLEEGWDFSNISFFLTVFIIIGFSVILGTIVFVRLQRDGIWVR